MSLNGLDDPLILEAYQASLVEPGGWFLLDYVSRDSVKLLAKGKAGVAEARNAITAYTEPSPLYGLIIYRRRRVLIKYVPKSISRLLLARTTVHFQDIVDRYTPFETLLEIATGEALNDTSLASAFPLHTASPSASSTRLHEISEDGEETGTGLRLQPAGTQASGMVTSAQRYKMERRVDQIMKSDLGLRPPSSLWTSRDANRMSALPASSTTPSAKPSLSQFLVHDESGHTSITPIEDPLPIPVPDRPDTDSVSAEQPDGLLVQEADSQSSSAPILHGLQQSVNLRDDRQVDAETASLEPSLTESMLDDATETSETLRKAVTLPTTYGGEDDPYDFSKFDELFKPKVKLGPRPVAAGEKTKRPTVASIAGVPAQFRPSPKRQARSQAGLRPPSSGSTMSTASSVLTLAPPSIPHDREYQPRPVSRGSVKSSTSQKQGGMTPDKLRLMKALELRKKQMRKLQPHEEDATETTSSLETLNVARTEAAQHSEAVADIQRSTQEVELDETQGAGQFNKADSGISLRYDERSDNGGEVKALEAAEHGGDMSAALEIVDQSPAHDQADVSTSASSYTPATTPIASPANSNADEQHAAIPKIVLGEESRPPTAEEIDKSTPNDARDDVQVSTVPQSLDERSEPSSFEDSELPPRQAIDVAKRRRGYVEPLQLDVSGVSDISGNPDDFHSDDEEFLDELDSATLQEAKPIMVAKSPINPSFQRQLSAASLRSDSGTPVKSINIPKPSAERVSPESKQSHSPPSKQSHSPPPSASPAPGSSDSRAGVARSVSSGISKRIAALAEISSREQAISQGFPSRPLTPETSNSFLQQDAKDWKSSLKTTSRNRPTTFKRQSSRNNMAQGQTSAANLDHASVQSVQHDPTTNRNSVSVTARIIRPQPSLESEERRGSLGPLESISTRPSSDRLSSEVQSPNIIKANSFESSTAPSPDPSQSSLDLRSVNRFPPGGRNKAFSLAIDQSPPPPVVRKGSATSVFSSDENGTPKEGSRTTRFFKRMSNLGNGGSSKRKSGQAADKSNNSAGNATSAHNLTQAASTDGSRSAVAQNSYPDTPPPVVVGDLNIQFPDSLLWKRRILNIDATGHLIFSPSQTSTASLSKSSLLSQKRYPISSFKCPYAPDLDSQELPHSVLFEFEDGTVLQAACEDAVTHRKVLGLLRGYWRAWTGVAASM